MKNRWLALFLVLVLFVLHGVAFAAKEKEVLPIVGPEEGDYPPMPALTEEGFLVEGVGEQEFIHVDEETGLWIYLSPTLHLEIKRHTDPNKPLIWYLSDIYMRGDERLQVVASNPDKPGSRLKHPEVIARENQLVFAINDDFFGDRQNENVTVGIIIRNGTVINSKTYKNDVSGFPNLETMAFHPDGTLSVHKSRELTADEYLEQGVADVLAFGPIVIRDGEVNDNLSKRNRNLEPRCVLGMVEPLHYIAVTVEGRHKKSQGVGLEWLAEYMQGLGVKQALNLDGGQTVALVFMGEKINVTGKYGAKANIRNLSGMIGAGTSQQVPESKK